MNRAVSCIADFLSATAKVFLLLIFILFLPQLFLWHIRIQEHKAIINAKTNHFKLGIEIVSKKFLKGLTQRNDLSYSIGLITNQTGIDQNGNRTIDILLKKGVQIKTLFSPHHGFDGTLTADSKGGNGIDLKTNIPIINLHGKDGIKKLNKENLAPLDVLIFDLQDVGIRYYGYAVTLLEAMYAAARHNKIIVVLDRPNLLGGCMEGAFTPIHEYHTNSIASIPLRHGMTICELASFYNKYILTKPANLYVVPMQNYNRTQTQIDFIMANLSPNLASLNSCYGYSFLGLLGEINPLDVGIGTDKAFQCIMLPDKLHFSQKKWKELSQQLAPLGIETTFFRYVSKRKKQHYSGLRFFIRNINTFSSCKTLLIIANFLKQSGVFLSFSSYFDTVIRTKTLRNLIMGIITKEKAKEEFNTNMQQFFNKACSIFLYKPFPQPLIM